MYTGPGSGSMLASAAAWDGLTRVLDSAAVAYGSVIAGLSLESWLGPASTSMAAAAAPYAGWLGAAATLAQQTAAQATAAAAAFDAAFAATVPPPLIEANRGQLTSLVATNILGQNSPAIETLQADYAEMWAQDAAAMYGYAAASEVASTLTPFTQPLQSADPAGAAAAASTGAATETNVQAALAQLASVVPQTLQALASPGSYAPLMSALSAAQPAASISIPTPIGDLDIIALYIATIGTLSLGAGVTNASVNIARPWNTHGGNCCPGADEQEPHQNEAPVVLVSGPGVGWTGPASASVAEAAMVGGLSVPHSWTMSAPEIRLAVESLPSSGLGGVPAHIGGAPAGLLSGMALAGLAGRGIGGVASPTYNGPDSEGEEVQRKPTVVVIQKPPRATGPAGNRPQ
jgi:PPE-repeat protein